MFSKAGRNYQLEDIFIRPTLREYAKRLRLSWKRYRRSLRQKGDEIAFQMAKEELAEFLAEPDLNVVYLDEAGVSLKGVVPYGWQPIGQCYEIPVTGAHGSNLQTLAFKWQDGETHMHVHKGYVNSEMVISIFDDYCQRLKGQRSSFLTTPRCTRTRPFRPV